MSKLKLGVNKVSNEEYHADKEYLSSSNLKTLLKDPDLFYREKYGGEKREWSKKQMSAFEEGSYTHSMILEPELINEEYAVFPEFRKQGKQWESFKAANSDKTILSKPQVKRCESYFDSYTKNPVAPDLIEGGEPEHTLCVELEGVPIKVRTDYINIEKGYIADVKTTGNPPDIDSFKITIDDFGYELSAALYCMAAEKFYGKPFDFYFIVIGKKESRELETRPIACQVYKASRNTLALGKHKVKESLKLFKKCKESGKWEKPKAKSHGNEYEILEI